MADRVSALELGRRALSLDCGVAALGDEIVAIPPPPGVERYPYGPLVGVRCGAGVEAVGYPLAARLTGRAGGAGGEAGGGTSDKAGSDTGGETSETRIAVVVSRSLAPRIVDPARDEPLVVEVELGPAVDVGRRALGLATPVESTPVCDALDVFWLDGIMSATLRLGPDEPLSWASVSTLHPLTDAPIQPWDLRNRRLRLPLGWGTFRRRASNASSPWPGMEPSIAAWLDDGSFARWCLADLPERDMIVEDLRDLLEPSAMAGIDEALAPPGEWIRRWR